MVDLAVQIVSPDRRKPVQNAYLPPVPKDLVQYRLFDDETASFLSLGAWSTFC